MLSDRDLQTLVDVAEGSVHGLVADGRRVDPDLDSLPASLHQPLAVFVTLRRGGSLRGCIGMMEPKMPVAQAVADRARAAASDDPRFPAVTADELGDLDVEISVLSPMEEFSPGGYEQLIDELRPGTDGLLVESGHHRATFLPQVWDDLPDQRRFVEALWHKAGMSPGEWRGGVTRVWRYSAQHWPT